MLDSPRGFRRERWWWAAPGVAPALGLLRHHAGRLQRPDRSKRAR